MNPDEYLKDRLDDQIRWYDKKSQWNQWWYKWLRRIEIVAAALIPFVAGLTFVESLDVWPKVAAGALGVVVAAVSALLGLGDYQELWINYRRTCEMLKHHRYLYLTQTEPYHGEDPFHLLVITVEALVSKEHSQWAKLFEKEKDAEPGKPKDG